MGPSTLPINPEKVPTSILTGQHDGSNSSTEVPSFWVSQFVELTKTVKYTGLLDLGRCLLMDMGFLFFCIKDENVWVPDISDSYAENVYLLKVAELCMLNG